MLPPEFHFLRPGWLLLLPLVPLLLLWLARARRDRRRWEAVCDAALLPHVLVAGTPGRRRRWPGVAASLVASLALIALAGPAWERLPQPVYRSQSALVIALDLSRSMAATDLPPSRLERARYVLRDILSARKDGQTGLLVFAADAFVVSPLTDDTATIEAQVPALEPDIMPAQGSRPDRAVELAAELLDRAGVGRGEILLVTDGAAAPAAATAAARAAASRGHSVSVLAVGTAAGAPIPAPAGGFVTDAAGAIVIPRVDETVLADVAAAGGGTLTALDGDPLDLTDLAARWQRAGAGREEDGRVADVWLDRGPWAAALAVPLVLLGFRRGVLVLAACAMLPLAPQARAAGWDDLWSRPDQRAAAALAAGDAARAQALFEDRRWRGAAAYRAGDYAAAADALAGLEDADSLYNRGNALARAGRIDEALASYEEALARAPEHEDARYNRDLLRELAQPASGQSAGGDSTEDQSSQASPGQDERSGDDRSGTPEGEGGGDPAQAEPETGGGAQAARDGQDGRAGQQDPDELGAAERAALERQAAADRDEADDARAQDERAAASGADAADEAGTDGGEAGADARPRPELADSSEADEAAVATEQWLRRIPDDPGGLLRRKFYYQYRERGSAPDPREDEQPW